jgi:hypothetical protein
LLLLSSSIDPNLVYELLTDRRPGAAREVNRD